MAESISAKWSVGASVCPLGDVMFRRGEAGERKLALFVEECVGEGTQEDSREAEGVRDLVST